MSTEIFFLYVNKVSFLDVVPLVDGVGSEARLFLLVVVKEDVPAGVERVSLQDAAVDVIDVVTGVAAASEPSRSSSNC